MPMLILLALTVAASQPAAVQVAPADSSAPFQGDKGALKFDPTCRDYNFNTVVTDPACAERVEKLEAAPTLAIAAHTLGEVPARAADAVQLLERAAAASGHPAIHYLLGNVLGTAQQIRPDYPAAVRHLTIAAERGNPAAADLLASLLVAGKGTDRDVPRALRLYRQAAANGFPTAAVSLGKFYLEGRVVTKDESLGRAWLDAAAKVGVPQATQLAALAANDSKINNYQLLSAADPAQIRVVRYGTFDNPDIPPNFGFDPAFQRVHAMPYSDTETLARLKSDAAKLPTPYLYELSRRLASTDPDLALQTYFLARTRMTYDATRCEDPAALEALRAWDLLVGGDIRFLLADGRPLESLVDSMLTEEAKLPGDTTPWWVCRSGLAAMNAAMQGKPTPLRLKPTSEWPRLRSAARDQVASLAQAK